MSIICNPRPRKYKYSSNNPTSRNTNKVEAVRVRTGLGLDTLSARSTGCIEDYDDTKVVAEAVRVPFNKVEEPVVVPSGTEMKIEVPEEVKEVVEAAKEKVDYNEKFNQTQEVLAAKQDPEPVVSTVEEDTTVSSMADAIRQAIKESEEDKEEMTTEVNNTEEQATSSFGTSMADILARMPKVEEEESSDDEDSDPEPDTDKMEQIIDEALKQIAEQREKVHLPIKAPETTDSEEPKTYDVDTGFIPSNDGTTEAPVDESDELGGAPTPETPVANPFV
jgi:hypothetical protein